MHGIVLKRLGHDVTILEQSLSSTREGQAAGIVTMECSQDFLARHDHLQNKSYAVNCSAVQILDKTLKVKHEFQRAMQMSSWNVLYYRLRANFDGLTSPYCARGPSEPPGVGEALYDHGKKAIGVQHVDNVVQVEYEDLLSHTKRTLWADLVLVADGSASPMRALLQPHLKHTYAGYVAWRGTVVESSVSEETRNTFKNKTTLHSFDGGYVAL